jgi:acetyltransferase (GNAT) family protein
VARPIWRRLHRIDTPNVVCANLGDMSNAIIRPATCDDLPGVLDLYRYLHPDDAQPDSARAEAAWSALLGSGLTIVVVAGIEGVLVSSCTLAIIPNLTRGARSYGVIENVVTDAGHRRTGLGRSVLASALKGCMGCQLLQGHAGHRRTKVAPASSVAAKPSSRRAARRSGSG